LFDFSHFEYSDMTGDNTLTFPLELELPVANGGTGPNGNRQQRLITHVARADEADEIFEFLLSHFFPLAPIRQLGLYDESEEAKRPEWIQDLVRDCVKTPHSLLVRDVCRHQQIVAVAINEFKTKNSTDVGPSSEPYASKSSNPAQIPVGRLHKAVLEYINRDVNVFDIYKTDLKMELSILAVDDGYARQGLATKLVEFSLGIARAEGAGAVWTEALSEYTAKVTSKFGFDILRTVKYYEFKFDEDFPLANIPGHRVGHLMALKI
jgi:GNAT superfamily N-acetyltransferase